MRNIGNKKALWTCLVPLLLFTMATVHVGAAETQIRVDPKSYTARVGDVFKMKINVIDVNDLAGFEFKLFWDRTLLNVTATSYTVPDPSWMNPFWLPYPPAKPLNNTYNATHGLFYLGCTNLPPVAISGDFTLATLTFKVMDTGSCTLDLRETLLTKITEAEPKPLVTPINHTIVDGYFTSSSPKALFTYSPDHPDADEAVTFDASASFDPDGHIVSYAWDFDDGNITTLSGTLITHVYEVADSYNVTLTVTDNASVSNTDIAWKIIKVNSSSPFSVGNIAILIVIAIFLVAALYYVKKRIL